MHKGLKKYFVNMDDYLASLGLYRKIVARDASSLFRAVSEQLYYSQNYHHRIRQDCANFMRANASVFEPFVEGSFEKYLERLEDPKETVGQVEIKALSQLYRRCFLIYRYPGKPPTFISEDHFVDQVTLCCSINGHYDIIYPRTYPASAALCQGVVYQLLYTKVFGCEEAELCQAVEAFRVGGRRYRNSVCSDEVPEERGHREEAESGGATDEKQADDGKLEAPPPCRLPYKVMKSLDGEVYRNVEFDVWQDTCKEMQKSDYMVFAGRQYFLGDKCQVRLEPKGKYFNAFIQEVGTHSAAVTVFIEELGEKHLVPLTDLKPVNPVPAWNVAAPSRKGDPDCDTRGQRHHRHRYFRKSRGGMKGAELLIAPPSYGGLGPSTLPPRFQPAGHPRPPPPPSAGAMTYDLYAPPHHHHPPAGRPPRYGTSRSSTRFLNRHLIGPQLTYYPPTGRRYYDYESYAFRSRRSRRQNANKECQFSFSDATEDVTYYQLDHNQVNTSTHAILSSTTCPRPQGPSVPQSPAMATPPAGSSYRVQRGSGPLPGPPGSTLVCSSEEDQEDVNTVEAPEFREDFIYNTQDPTYQTASIYTAAESATSQDQQEGGVANSPPRSDMTYSYTQQVVKPLGVISSSPSSSSSSSPSSSSSRAPAATHLPVASHAPPRSVAMAIPAASPWLVNEMGETVCAVLTPPPYSYDPNGNDLPRDYRVLQYYFNLGVQWYWQQQQVYTPPSPDPYQHCPPYLGQDAGPPSYPEAGRGPQQPPSFPECTRAADGQAESQGGSGPAPSMEGCPLTGPPSGPASSALLYQDQAPLLHLPYDAPPPAGYLAPPPAPHHAHHTPYQPCLPWGAFHAGSRVYCPTTNPAHVVGYLAAPTHYIPPAV
ncbi:putative bifunctional UDP-N-acetylglucosamine transferase and deubiquitinase ALG13 isoform X2 [Nerophis lumbriciformis]|uniref:putative bifunctional UDP-N-acetylglucosamine transferase and deubiquitinase ALG13 isoform X2 n=1 Tax=Nerophis lumbriciformis TaxID=546530 RepID=UPI002ADFF73F|nr:putative bifunctional UDP-N-acetylglucosamine transferase and deubiquitinase ALG13 isoform X2 [Nerophis lumbriciformis]